MAMAMRPTTGSTDMETQVTMRQATAVIKNCIRLGLSTIAFARSLFPAHAFETRQYAGVQLMVLRAMDETTGEVLDKSGLMLQEWIEKGVFDALQRGYLASVDLDVFDRHPNDPFAKLLEKYAFVVDAPANGAEELTMRMSGMVVGSSNDKPASHTPTQPTPTKESIHASMQRMIKSIVMLTSSLDELPHDRFVSMSVGYNSSVPSGYEPPFFCAAPPVGVGAGAAGTQPKPKTTMDMPLGHVNTGFGSVALSFVQPVVVAVAAAAAVGLEEEVPPTQKVVEDDDDDADAVDRVVEEQQQQWKQAVDGAQRIAKAVGRDMAETAIRSSNVVRGMPSEQVDEVVALALALSPPPALPAPAVHVTATATATNHKSSRVKRPLHQTLQGHAEPPSTTAASTKRREMVTVMGGTSTQDGAGDDVGNDAFAFMSTEDVAGNGGGAASATQRSKPPGSIITFKSRDKKAHAAAAKSKWGSAQ